MAQVNENIRYEPDERPPPLHRRWSRFSGRGGHHRAGGAQRDHYCPGGQPAGELPDLGRLRGAADQWSEHGSASGPGRADRGRARARHGYLRCFHRSPASQHWCRADRP